MKEKIKRNKIIILVIVLILLGIGTGIGIWQYRHQKAVILCKEKCIYITTENKGTFTKPEYIEVDYWRFGEYPNYRKFPTQEQCIDYCSMNLKK